MVYYVYFISDLWENVARKNAINFKKYAEFMVTFKIIQDVYSIGTSQNIYANNNFNSKL